MNQTVEIEQCRSSLGSINKDEQYKMNKNIGTCQFSPKIKSCHTNDINPLIAHQTIVAANFVLSLNIHNQFDNDRNNNNTTKMKEVESNLVQCQTDDNNESRCNTIATLLLTFNDEINEYNTYNESNILEEEKSVK